MPTGWSWRNFWRVDVPLYIIGRCLLWWLGLGASYLIIAMARASGIDADYRLAFWCAVYFVIVMTASDIAIWIQRWRRKELGKR